MRTLLTILITVMALVANPKLKGLEVGKPLPQLSFVMDNGVVMDTGLTVGGVSGGITGSPVSLKNDTAAFIGFVSNESVRVDTINEFVKAVEARYGVDLKFDDTDKGYMYVGIKGKYLYVVYLEYVSPNHYNLSFGLSDTTLYDRWEDNQREERANDF